MTLPRFLRCATLVLPLMLCGAAAAAGATLPPEQAAALKRIRADSLRGHLMFLASDLLEGRGTPSRGQDLAAEYIAAQYRRAGLEPLGDDGYFQSANWIMTEPVLDGFAFTLRAGQRQLALPAKQIGFVPGGALHARAAAIVKADWQDLAPLEAQGAAVAGKVVLLEQPAMQPKSMEEYKQMMATKNAVLARIAALKPLLVLALDRSKPAGNAGGGKQVDDPASPKPKAPLTLLTMHGPAAIAFYDAQHSGATLDLTLPAAKVQPVKLRNVAALLRGSDPALKNTYVILSAHYDHIGTKAGDGDQIFNGANDNGSGTASLIEVAHALAGMPARPKRSIVFLNVFGEELGMLGSQYYGRNPLVPLAATVANLNLEQVGRTDGPEGQMLARAALTGFDFSTLPATLVAAGKDTGVAIYKDARYSDKYFAQSDNQAFANVGIPAHTLSVLYQFADYHGAGDHWPLVNYENMALINRTVARSLLLLANDKAVPAWSKQSEAAAPYLKAQQALTPGR